MRLTHLIIKNIGHLEHFEADIPAVAIIQGKNRVGKSTIVEALMYMAGRRVGKPGQRAIFHDAGMLHGTAERGEIIAKFDDPDGDLEYLKCSITPRATERFIKSTGATAYVEAGSNLDRFFNALNYNPFIIKMMDAKQRVEEIIRMVPPPVTAEEIAEAVGGAYPCTPRPDLSSLNEIHDDIFELRTEVNRAADTLKKQAELLAKTPGTADNTDWTATLASLRSQQKDLDESESEEMSRIASELADLKVHAEKEAAKAIDAKLAEVEREYESVTNDLNTQIAGLRAQIATLEGKLRSSSEKANTLRREIKTTIESEKQAYVQTAIDKANAERQEIKEANRPRREEIAAAISAADIRAEVQQQAEGARQAAISTADQAKQKEGEAQRLSGALERLRALKSDTGKRMKLSPAVIQSPRPGAPVDLCREEAGAMIPFSKWNTRDQNMMCLRLALMAQAQCGLVVIDSIGDFDAESLRDLRETCHEYSDATQFLVGAVTEGPLRIEPWV